jgi:hypothetical protein
MGLTIGAADPTGTRRHDLDLLRALVVAGLLLFHTACIFVPGHSYVTNPTTNFVMMTFVFFAKLWGMPLLFMVAGVGIWHSLGTRTGWDFARERPCRLLAPLVVGVAFLVPLQLWYHLRATGQDPGSYWTFLSRFFDVRLSVGFPFVLRAADPDGLFELSHLWFLYDLLVYGLLLLPLFLWLRRGGGQELVGRLGTWAWRPWGFFVLALPVVAIEVGLGTIGPGSWHSYSHVPFLVLGFLIAADRRLAEAVRRSWRKGLVVGIAALPALFAIPYYDLGGPERLLGADYHPCSLAFRLLKGIAGWAWTVALFGLVSSLSLRRRAPEFPVTPSRPAGSGQLSRYANEAVLPFYVLHHSPIIVIGFYVVQWEIGVWGKFLVISAASLAATLAVYDLCVRRTNLTRALFGMSPVKAPAPVPADRPVSGARR